ncbi:MAG: hypothetical protein ACPGUV_02145 [Polyangiales bacterium]
MQKDGTVPWEEPKAGRSWTRWRKTIALPLRPLLHAPAFAGTSRSAAWRFWAVTFVPLALLRGIIPATRTLQFGPLGHIKALAKTDAMGVTLDVLQAMGQGLALTLLQWLALALPWISLCRAYGSTEHDASLRAMLYQAWLLPLGMGGLFFGLAAWLSPATPPAWLWLSVMVLDLLPLLLLLQSMRAVARFVHGVSPWMSWVVITIPMVLLFLLHALAGELLPQLVAMPK